MIIAEINTIKWRCRRGMLELDLLLNSFVDNCLNNLTTEHIKILHELLLKDDAYLEQWLIKSPELTPEKYQIICQKISQNVVA